MTRRIGFIGAGFIAGTYNWFLKHTAADHRLVAIHDLDSERAREFADRVGPKVVGEDSPTPLREALPAHRIVVSTR